MVVSFWSESEGEREREPSHSNIQNTEFLVPEWIENVWLCSNNHEQYLKYRWWAKACLNGSIISTWVSLNSVSAILCIWLHARSFLRIEKMHTTVVYFSALINGIAFLIRCVDEDFHCIRTIWWHWSLWIHLNKPVHNIINDAQSCNYVWDNRKLRCAKWICVSSFTEHKHTHTEGIFSAISCVVV